GKDPDPNEKGDGPNPSIEGSQAVTSAPGLDASFWFFLLSLIFLSVSMVLAMVPFMLALVAHPRQKKANPLSIEELRVALLALNTLEREWRLGPLSDNEMRLDWNVVDAS